MYFFITLAIYYIPKSCFKILVNLISFIRVFSRKFLFIGHECLYHHVNFLIWITKVPTIINLNLLHTNLKVLIIQLSYIYIFICELEFLFF